MFEEAAAGACATEVLGDGPCPNGQEADAGGQPEGYHLDPPPLNWSDLIVRVMKEDRYGEEDIQARGDCFEAASG